MYLIEFTKTADKTIAKYKRSNPSSYKKLLKLLDEIIEHPREGTGHPEPLKIGDNVTFSRRITQKDRIIYDIYDDVVKVLILAVEGHYTDK